MLHYFIGVELLVAYPNAVRSFQFYCKSSPCATFKSLISCILCLKYDVFLFRLDHRLVLKQNTVCHIKLPPQKWGLTKHCCQSSGCNTHFDHNDGHIMCIICFHDSHVIPTFKKQQCPHCCSFNASSYRTRQRNQVISLTLTWSWLCVVPHSSLGDLSPQSPVFRLLSHHHLLLVDLCLARG